MFVDKCAGNPAQLSIWCADHTLHSTLVCMNSTLWNFNCLPGILSAGCLLIMFWWNLETHLPWPLLHQIVGSAVFTVLWVPLSYRVARPGFSDSHDLPSHGVQFSTGLSRSVSGQRSSAAIYPAQCVNYRRTILVLPRHLAARGHCSTLLHSLRVPCYNPSHCPVQTCTRHPGPGLQTCKQCLVM